MNGKDVYQSTSDDKDVILLFSGGRDSFLSACILVEQGYRVHMITFENGLGIQAENARHGADRLRRKYGDGHIHFYGIANIAGFWRQLFDPFYNLKPSQILKEYGELTASQFHCLTCRLAMYVWTIVKAKQDGYNFIADGARENQGFIVELPRYFDKLRRLLNEYGLQLLLPVFSLDSDSERKNQLLLRGFTPKVIEPQCLIGIELPSRSPLDEEVQIAAIRFFEKSIEPKMRNMINNAFSVRLDLSGSFV